MSELKSKYEQVLEKLKAEGRVIILGDDQKDTWLDKLEEDLDAYRFENQKRIRDSQEAIAQVVLTA